MTQQRIIEHKRYKEIELFTDNKDTARKIQDRFSAFEPGYEYDSTYNRGAWDGKTNFYDVKVIPGKNGPIGWMFTLDIGFKKGVEKLTQEKFPSEVDTKPAINFLREEIKRLPFTPYKHQAKFFVEAADADSHFGISSVGSGKSLVIYLLTRYKRYQNKKILILVPTIDLVHQMYKDFEDYNAPTDFMEDIQQIGGEFKNKDITKNVVISTWQSAVKSDLRVFEVVLNDEVHTAKADVLQTILSMPNFKQKIGLTGTSPIEPLDALKLENKWGSPLLMLLLKI